MVQLFISHSEEDRGCVEQLRAAFGANGYRIWQNTQGTNRTSLSYLRTIENGIRSSAAIVLVWSAGAARSEWVERQVLFAQRLQKLIVPLVVDGTDLPITLVNIQGIAGASPCDASIEQLLPLLPLADSTDLLNALLEQLPHPHIRERKAAIESAARLLQRGEHREEVLALLDDIARRDLIESVRKLAQSVIGIDIQSTPTSVRPEEMLHKFGAKCPNGHVTYFDKRRVCPPSRVKGYRNLVQRGGAEIDELALPCGNCGVVMIVPVDCEGYK